MSATAFELLKLNGEEAGVLAQVLESERARLLVEIRHTDHRVFRDQLKHRLGIVEQMLNRCVGKAEARAESSHDKR